MATKIYFDMDGTIADLYGVDGWLADLMASNARPYKTAKPMVNMNRLARKLNRLQRKGYTIGVISWLAKNGTDTYNAKVAEAKKQWLKRHLASVKFNEIHIVEYGTPKQQMGKGVLFDDEIGNRVAWGDGAYDPAQIFEILNSLN